MSCRIAWIMVKLLLLETPLVVADDAAFCKMEPATGFVGLLEELIFEATVCATTAELFVWPLKLHAAQTWM
jgi:hypothetical protein